MNALQKALVQANLAQEPKSRKSRNRKYKCRKCGADMEMIEGTNTMACTECNNFFIFTHTA